MLHQVNWHPTEYAEQARPAHVALVGGDAETRSWCQRDLAAARVSASVHADPADLPADLGPDAIVLVLPDAEHSALDAVDTVLGTLKHLLDKGIDARLWALTQRVHEGCGFDRSPLWGLSRVATTEHPQLWGGVLDLADRHLPLGRWPPWSATPWWSCATAWRSPPGWATSNPPPVRRWNAHRRAAT